MNRPGLTPWVVVDDLAEAIEAAARFGDGLVVDLENTLVAYGCSTQDRDEAMRSAVERVAADGRLRRLAFVSNGRFDLPLLGHDWLRVLAVASARKPRVRRGPLSGLRSELAGASVYGDQPLTDGLLARNLEGVWLQPRHAHDRAEAEPWGPRWLQIALREAGKWVIERRFQRLAGPASCPPE